MRSLHRILFTTAVALLAVFCVIRVALSLLDQHLPPDLHRYHDLSVVVTDRDGVALRSYLSGDDTWRLPPETFPGDYEKLLILTEDKRFPSHHGIDWLAVLRAAVQNLRAGRIVSGASTLTMQSARLLEPRPRTLKSKLIETFRAWQLEKRFSKAEILRIYATLAPMGGNIEGIEAAARRYFNKPAAQLSLAETAWLIALPQAPKRLHQPDKALAARNRILTNAYQNGLIDEESWRGARENAPAPGHFPFPFSAAHLSDRYRHKFPDKAVITTPVAAQLQNALQNLLHRALSEHPPQTNLAGAILDNASGAYLAYVGSADFFSKPRHGQVDMLRAIRSPGSLLKPFITLYAIDWLNYRPQTRIRDSPIVALPYRPVNYDRRYHGTLSLAQALIRSRNTPAVRLLSLVKPPYFAAALEKQGMKLHFPPNGRANLAMALGGVGTTATDLIHLYRHLANCAYATPDAGSTAPLARDTSCGDVTRMLQSVGDRDGPLFFGAQPVAVKTGTSYGWRDLWVIGYTPRYSVILWRGRADGGYTVQQASATALLPLLRNVFALLDNPPRLVTPVHHIRARPGFPEHLRQVGVASIQAEPEFVIANLRDPIEIAPGATLPFRLAVATRGGAPPLQWWLNGRLVKMTHTRATTLLLSATGRYHLTVLDRRGQSCHRHIVLASEPEALRGAPVTLRSARPPRQGASGASTTESAAVIPD